MAEQVPATPTDAEVVTVESSSFDEKLAAKLGLSPDPRAEQPEVAEEATPEGELAPDDIQVEEPTEPEGEWLELDRKGEKRKVSKEEAKRLAQQGWDYSTNQEQLKAEKAQVAQERAAAQALAQVTPLVVDAAANVKYFERALQQYGNVDWVAAAQADPLGFPAVKMQYDQLRDGYNQAMYQFNQASQAAQQINQTIDKSELQQQHSRVLDAAPELRDPVRYKTEATRIAGYLKEQGITEQEVNALSDSRYMLIARDAMRYRAAINARAEKQNTAPASLKPGPAPVRMSADAKARETVKKLHQAKDPAQKKSLFEAALAAKLERLA
jgi:hypothetical protein